jgi:hypothetical protein
MSVFTQHVEIQVYDLNDFATWGLDPGFYYNIPLTHHDDEVALQGPYETEELALAEAAVFVRDAIAEHPTPAVV